MTDNDIATFRVCLEVLVGAIVFIGLLIFCCGVWEMFRKGRVRE